MKIENFHKYYFVELENETPVIYYGELVSIVPKFGNKDAFSVQQLDEMEKIYLFNVEELDGDKKITSAKDRIFDSCKKAIRYCKGERFLFSNSLLKID